MCETTGDGRLGGQEMLASWPQQKVVTMTHKLGILLG